MSSAEREAPVRPPFPWRMGAPRLYDALAALLRDLRFRPGWKFELWTHDHETVLAIDLVTVNTYHPPDEILVGHRFPVPPFEQDRPAWRRWLLDRIGDVDRHEVCEWWVERVPPVADRFMATALPEVYESARDSYVRPFDPHHDPMTPAYRVVDWTAE